MITYENVSMAYPDSGKVLDDLNFSIEKGEFFVIVGPSGSGKTTTLKLINRLIEQTEGDIYFKDKKLKDYPLRDLRLNIGYVLQQIALFPNLTVAENISLIPEMKKMDKKVITKRADELLEQVGLDPDKYRNRLPEDLSGGEKQRIGILRAIAANPEILLMDEPFSALDPISKTQLQDLIKNIHDDYKITTVFVTHDMDEALKLADRICVMKDGKIVQIARPSEIMDNPENDFVSEFFKNESDISYEWFNKNISWKKIWFNNSFIWALANIFDILGIGDIYCCSPCNIIIWKEENKWGSLTGNRNISNNSITRITWTILFFLMIELSFFSG